MPKSEDSKKDQIHLLCWPVLKCKLLKAAEKNNTKSIVKSICNFNVFWMFVCELTDFISGQLH